MRKFTLAIILLFPLLVSAQGIEFFHGTFEEAKVKAAEEEKLIFVDCYTTWCGPCKMMTNKIFPLPAVGDLYNKNFIALKLDMEKEQGMLFGQKYPVSAYPTLYFLSSNGEIIQKVVGAKREPEFIALGHTMIKKNDQSDSYARKFEEGERDFSFMVKYIKELNKVEKSAIGVTNKYLKEQPSITSSQKAELLMLAVTESDSKLFDELVSLKSEVIKQSSVKAFEEKILAASFKTVDKAIEYEYEDLLNDAIQKVSDNLPKKGKIFEYQALMRYAKAFKNYEDWEKHAKKYFKKNGKNYETYSNLIADVQGFYRKNEDAKQDMFKWYDQLIKCDECGVDEYLSYSKVLLENGNKAKALEVANLILTKNKNTGGPTQKIEHFIRFIEKQS